MGPHYFQNTLYAYAIALYVYVQDIAIFIYVFHLCDFIV